jgi:hypothetical protein
MARRKRGILVRKGMDDSGRQIAISQGLENLKTSKDMCMESSDIMSALAVTHR